MSQTNYISETVSWSIDRNPDYNTESAQNIMVEECTDYVEATDYLSDYNPIIEYYHTRIPIEELSLQPFDDTSIIRSLSPFTNRNYEDFIPFDSPTGSQVNIIFNEFELSEEDINCCICMSDKNIQQMCSLNCCHTFCVECIDIHLNTNHNCPLCRTYITQMRIQTIEAIHKIHH